MFDLKKLQQESQEISNKNQKEHEFDYLYNDNEIKKFYRQILETIDSESFEDNLQNAISYVMKKHSINYVYYDINITMDNTWYTSNAAITVTIKITNNGNKPITSQTILNEKLAVRYTYNYKEICKDADRTFLYDIAQYFVKRCDKLGLSTYVDKSYCETHYTNSITIRL